MILLIRDLYPYFPHSVKYLKNVFTSVFILSLRNIISFLSNNLALGQGILLIIPKKIWLKALRSILIMIIVSSVFIDLEKAFDTVDPQIL